MAKNESKDTAQRTPLVTSENKVSRRKNPGFINPHRGIEVEPGLNLQDVPRSILVQHLKANEQMAKQRFAAKYGEQYGGQQSF